MYIDHLCFSLLSVKFFVGFFVCLGFLGGRRFLLLLLLLLYFGVFCDLVGWFLGFFTGTHFDKLLSFTGFLQTPEKAAPSDDKPGSC